MDFLYRIFWRSNSIAIMVKIQGILFLNIFYPIYSTLHSLFFDNGDENFVKIFT